MGPDGHFENNGTISEDNNFGMQVVGNLERTRNGHHRLNVATQLTKMKKQNEAHLSNQISSVLELEIGQAALLGHCAFDGSNCLVLVRLVAPPNSETKPGELDPDETRRQLQKQLREAILNRMKDRQRGSGGAGRRGGGRGNQQDRSDPNSNNQPEPNTPNAQAQQMMRMMQQMMGTEK